MQQGGRCQASGAAAEGRSFQTYRAVDRQGEALPIPKACPISDTESVSKAMGVSGVLQLHEASKVWNGRPAAA